MSSIEPGAGYCCSLLSLGLKGDVCPTLRQGVVSRCFKS